MAAYEALTPSQIVLLQELKNGSFEMTIGEQTSSPRGKDLSFLMKAAFVRVEQTYIAQDDANNRYSYTWSGKEA